jgi:hypothetical protein
MSILHIFVYSLYILLVMYCASKEGRHSVIVERNSFRFLLLKRLYTEHRDYTHAL